MKLENGRRSYFNNFLRTRIDGKLLKLSEEKTGIICDTNDTSCKN